MRLILITRNTFSMQIIYWSYSLQAQRVLEGQATAQVKSCQLVLNKDILIYNLEQYASEITIKINLIMEGIIILISNRSTNLKI